MNRPLSTNPQAVWQRNLRARRRANGGLPADDPRHGKPDGYNGWGCRCELCSEAKRVAESTRPVYRHGVTQTGYRRGCRCDLCKQARLEYDRTGRPQRSRSKAATTIAALAVCLLTAGCRPALSSASEQPAVTPPAVFALASNRGPLLVEFPWCDDPQGHSRTGWPCQWDRLTSPAPGWDRQVPNIAIFVRAVDGCPVAVNTDGRRWACYWRPQDQAGGDISS